MSVDFWSRYSKICQQNNLSPSEKLARENISDTLECIMESFRSEHWKCILMALVYDNTLRKVHFASCVSPHVKDDADDQDFVQKNKCFPIPFGRSDENMRIMGLSLRGFLQTSRTICVMVLENLPFTSDNAEHLASGLHKAMALEVLSFMGSKFDEGAISVICKGLASCRTLSWLDFSSCALSYQDIEAISTLIKANIFRRSSMLFETHLRKPMSPVTDLPGLHRISLNYNNIENNALNLIIESMADDLWIKALDFENCNINQKGAHELLQLARTNTSLVVIDLRLNRIDKEILNRIAGQLDINRRANNVAFNDTFAENNPWEPTNLVKNYNSVISRPKAKKKIASKLKSARKQKGASGKTTQLGLHIMPTQGPQGIFDGYSVIFTTLQDKSTETIDTQSSGTIGPQSSEAIAPQRSETTSSQSSETVEPRSFEAIKPWSSKTIKPWCSGTINPWSSGNINPWSSDTVDPRSTETSGSRSSETISSSDPNTEMISTQNIVTRHGQNTETVRSIEKHSNQNTETVSHIKMNSGQNAEAIWTITSSKQCSETIQSIKTSSKHSSETIQSNKTNNKQSNEAIQSIKTSNKQGNETIQSPEFNTNTSTSSSPETSDTSVQTDNVGSAGIYMEVKELLMMVKNLKKQLDYEMKIKKYYTAKYNQVVSENERLRRQIRTENDNIHVDQNTFQECRRTFQKIHSFINIMKKYGLWEYIAMLGFDETTDLIIEENAMKITRNEACSDPERQSFPHQDACCHCRTQNFQNSDAENPNELVEDSHTCISSSSSKPSHKGKVALKEDPMNERMAHRLLQEAMNDYNNASFQTVLNSEQTLGRMPDVVNTSQDSVKSSGSKQSDHHSGSTSPKASADSKLIKKFSYSNMPKQLKGLVSPADFYNIVRKELESSENEDREALSHHAESDNSVSSRSNLAHTKSTSCKMSKHQNEVGTITLGEQWLSLTELPVRTEEDENMTISELIARERSTKPCVSKKELAKSPTSFLSSTKSQKTANRAKVMEHSESEQIQSKSKSSISNSQNSSKFLLKPSPENISSFDSIFREFFALRSRASSLSSNKSHSKASSGLTDSELQKSYIETASDASTSKDVESYSEDFESCTFSCTNQKNNFFSKDKPDSFKNKTKDEFVSSESTIKDSLQSKSSKPNETAVFGSFSKKSDTKTKNIHKNNKHRPKYTSSSSSSVPSLSDITAVSSRSLNTDSVMKQLSGSDGNKSKRKK